MPGASMVLINWRNQAPGLCNCLGTVLAYVLVSKIEFFKMVHSNLRSSDNASSMEGIASQFAKEAWLLRCEPALAGTAGGPLSGLRFAVKDNIDVAGLPTTAACPAFAYSAAAHAVVVQRLLEAGATLVGKTNMDQFACGLNGTRTPHGAVPNAFNAAYVSGGSSSGSAYVVATGQVDFALGTDTAGSGRVPAGLNNIVGLKPTKGLISARGVVPAAQSVDCVSIFARTVDVAASVLQVAQGYDAQDPYSRQLALACQPVPEGFRFGVPDVLDFLGDGAAEAAFAEAVNRLRSLGGTSVPIAYEPLAKTAALLYESALVAERYAAVRCFFDQNASEVVEPVRSILASGRSYSAADLFDAQTRLRALAQQVAPLWQGPDAVDVMLLPTAPTHYTIAAMDADPVALNRNLGAYTNFVNLLDYAAISVPSSLRPDGLPFGITLVGPCGSDWRLAELGQRYHQATGLTQGSTAQPLPAPGAIPGLVAPATVRVAVVGAHLSGMPLNGQLTERGARLLGPAETAPDYRFFALPGTVPPKPGLLRVEPGAGARIALEIWEMPAEHYGSFVALVPAPLGIGTLALDDGTTVQGFVCEALATAGAQDISHLGGWRAYLASLRSNA
jgi:allophanate hydrolase